MGGSISINTCFVASTKAPRPGDHTPEISSGTVRWRSASSIVRTESGWISSGSARYGSRTMLVLEPGIVSTLRTLPSNMREMGEWASRVPVVRVNDVLPFCPTSSH